MDQSKSRRGAALNVNELWIETYTYTFTERQNSRRMTFTVSGDLSDMSSSDSFLILKIKRFAEWCILVSWWRFRFSTLPHLDRQVPLSDIAVDPGIRCVQSESTRVFADRMWTRFWSASTKEDIPNVLS